MLHEYRLQRYVLFFNSSIIMGNYLHRKWCLSHFFSVPLQLIMKKGLVLEGGAMRGLWTAGVTDVMMEHNVRPDGLIGVSAGAAFGCNYKSWQVGRAIRYHTRFAKDKRYSGWRSLLTTGDYFNAQFGYHVVPYESTSLTPRPSGRAHWSLPSSARMWRRARPSTTSWTM
jgi:hypothetical protein